MFVRIPGQGPRSARPRQRRWGKRFCRGRDSSLLRQNGGALPSLRRDVDGHHAGHSVSQPLHPLGYSPNASGSGPFAFSYTLRAVAEGLTRDHKPGG